MANVHIHYHAKLDLVLYGRRFLRLIIYFALTKVQPLKLFLGKSPALAPLHYLSEYIERYGMHMLHEHIITLLSNAAIIRLMAAVAMSHQKLPYCYWKTGLKLHDDPRG